MLTKQTCLLISSFLLTVPSSSVGWWPLTSSNSCIEHKGILTILGGTLVALYGAWRWEGRSRMQKSVDHDDLSHPEGFIDEFIDREYNHGSWKYSYQRDELGSSDYYSLFSLDDGTCSQHDSNSDWTDF